MHMNALRHVCLWRDCYQVLPPLPENKTLVAAVAHAPAEGTPPFLYQKTYKKPTNYLLHKIMAELLQELVIVLQRRDWQ